MSRKLSLHCACNIDPLDNNMFYGSLIVMTFHAYITCCWVRRSLSCLRNKVSAKICDRKCYHHITKCFAVDIYAHKEYPQLFILYKHTPIPTWTLCVLHTFSDLNICNCCYIYILFCLKSQGSYFHKSPSVDLIQKCKTCLKVAVKMCFWILTAEKLI